MSVNEHAGQGVTDLFVFTVNIPNFTLEVQTRLRTSEVLVNPSTCRGGCRL